MALSNKKVSTSAPRWKYHVFLSFRGEDTRKGFTDHLFKELKERAISAYRDDPNLERGTTIDTELMLAIEQSRFSIVIISKNYASSDWCLLELAHIFRCMKEDGRIMPIFYGVEPRDVRHQTGTFSEHFTEHEKKLGKDGEKVREWRDALTKVGKLAGWNSENYRYDTALIKEIVDVVWKKVNPTFPGEDPTQKSVGLGKVNKIVSLLNLDSNDIRLVGIWGADEIAIKTTADLVHNSISDHFEVSSFLREIRKVSKSKSLVYLQARLLEQLNGRYVPVSDVYEGKNMTKNCVRNKKVLRILDDVDQSDQIEILGGEKDWYGNGSRIIITSMNRNLLVEHGIEEPYLVEGLNKDEALQLF
ncbi:putative TIR domain, P-loop containing nucleoside triphosphate hydrolase [Rosa chinensis]|uniref:Putative TIR domain, P-loop containing nucleoside triphosphate hydrolase n=1 Tax=Rosa chinensis TaxID=74649 RepID=A0A2P6PUG4_ROSCH|nr:disease resistance protein RPV1 [Rosa chinensis]PRQ25570.1 putative TIR domain, P-loop containing nucleoside triphosphate hydrolase [Rosa chinensis]